MHLAYAFRVSQKHPTLGVLLALTSSLLFGLNASTTKVLIQTGITAEQLTLFRCIAVALFSAVAMFAVDRPGFKLHKRELPIFLVFGIIGVGLMQWAYSNAVANLQVGIALLIEYTAIVIVPIASFLIFKKSISKNIFLAVALVLGGLAIVAKVWNAYLNPLGVLFGVLAAIFLSSYFILGEQIQKTRSAFSTMFWAFTVAAIFWLIWLLATRPELPDLSAGLNLTGNLAAFILPAWSLLVWVSIFGSFLPMLFTFLAMRHLSATGVGIASTAETVFAFVFGFLWLREVIDPIQAFGGILVVAGIVVAQVRSKATDSF